MTSTFPQTYKFTRIEWSLISDRLETPCCIAEALEEHCSSEDIIQRCDHLLDYKPGAVLSIQDEVDAAILADAIDGSNAVHTIAPAVDYGDKTRQEALVLYAAAARVEKKTGAYFPRD